MTAIFGLGGCGLLCVALIAVAFGLQALAIRVRCAVALLAAVAVFIPIGDLSAAAWVRGVTGDLSAPTLALAAGACASRIAGRRWFAPREWEALLAAVAAAAIFLYPFALGFTPFDPYALGYGSSVFITALLLATLAAWRAGLNLFVLVAVVAAAAYLAGAYESRNLWDYLVDPVAALYALGRWAAIGFRGRGRSFQRRQS
jgi:hypothetical protein